MNDLEPMMRLGHEALRPYIEPLRGWNQEEEKKGFLEHFEPNKIQIIQVESQDVGYFKLDNTQDCWSLEGLYIGATYRNRGLGSAVLEDILSMAKVAKKEVKLQVFKHNPAWHLYQRLGFKASSKQKRMCICVSVWKKLCLKSACFTRRHRSHFYFQS